MYFRIIAKVSIAHLISKVAFVFSTGPKGVWHGVGEEGLVSCGVVGWLPCKLGQCNLGHLDLITKQQSSRVGSVVVSQSSRVSRKL